MNAALASMLPNLACRCNFGLQLRCQLTRVHCDKAAMAVISREGRTQAWRGRAQDGGGMACDECGGPSQHHGALLML